ncbi:MAG: hemolysin family protein [Chthonomonadales bacterium]
MPNEQDPDPERTRRAMALSSLVPWVTLGTLFLMVAGGAGAQAGTPGAPHREGTLGRDLLFVGLLILANSLFVLIETAMLTVRRTRIEQLMEEGDRRAKVVHDLLAEPTRMLATIQVALTVLQLFTAGAAAESAVEPLGRYLRAHLENLPLLAARAHAIAFVATILAVALLTLVIGEITPKSIAIRHAEPLSLFAAWPLRGLQAVGWPVVSLVTWLSNWLVRPFGGTATFHTSAMTEEELKLMVEQSEEHGVIETEEKEMIHSIFDFGDTVVRKVMTPRLDIAAVEANATIDELIQAVTASGHSRLPVYDEDLDNIIGIVHVKDVLQALASDRRRVTVRDLMRPPYFIPENKRVDDLLAELRRSKTQLAVVRDEYGTVTGLVTIEDLLEEIVGEIQDEYDVEEEPDFVQVDERTCIIEGRMPLDDFNERMGVTIPVEESDTIGGFVFGLMGHQPAQGETAIWDGLEFAVEDTDGKRIRKVRVTRRTADEPPVDAQEQDRASDADARTGGADRAVEADARTDRKEPPGLTPEW